MSALALNQLLESSQDKGIELELETSALENQSVLEAVEKMSLDAMPKGGRRAVNLVRLRIFLFLYPPTPLPLSPF